MWRTACTHIITWDLYNTYLTLNLDLAAIIHIFQLILRRIKNLDFKILIYCLICRCLNLFQLFFTDRTIKIHCTVIGPQMKTDIVISKSFMHDTGYNMLPGMLLHLFKTFFPVDLSGHNTSHFQWCSRIMIDHIVFFMHICNVHSSQNSCICILTAAFREEYRLVQYHTVAILCFFTGNYFCCKFGSVTVLIK